MNVRLAVLSIACAAPLASGGLEHFDALLMIDPEGELVTGLVDFDAQQALAAQRRVFDAEFDVVPIGGGVEVAVTDVPGFNGLLPGNPSLPAGFSALPPGAEVAFDAPAFGFGGAMANLWHWDGALPVVFEPAAATVNISKAPSVLFSVDLDGSDADAPGFTIDFTNSSGGLHKHVDFQIADAQLAPDGFYLWSFTLRVGALEAAPVYFVHALGDFDQQAYDDATAFVRETLVDPAPACSADLDGDGDVDLSDFGIFGAAFGSVVGDAGYNPAADFDGDGDVDLSDFGVFGGQFGRTAEDCGG